MSIYHIEETDAQESGDESNRKIRFEEAFAQAGLNTDDPRFEIQHHHVPEEGVSVDITDKQAECLRGYGFLVRVSIS